MRKKYILLLVVSLLLSISLFGCSGSGSSAPPPQPLIEALLFSFPGSAPANFPNAMVLVADSTGMASITTATVVMNGVTLTYNAAPAHQQYEGTVIVAPGGSVTLSVTVEGNTYSASGTQFTAYPTISYPTALDPFYANNINTVTWSPGAPLTTAAVYLLGVLDAADPIGGNAYFQGLATSYNSFPIPAGSFTAGSRIVIVGITTPVSIPNAATNSFLIIGGFNYVPITVQ
jgi:hypothetical protein